MLILICIMSQRQCLTLLLTGIMLSVSASRQKSKCGDQDHFTTDSGSLQYPTPNTEKQYPNKAECTWVIETSGGSIELYFNQLDTEEYCDIVVIRDGDYRESPQLGNFSGNALPGSVKTTENKAYIKFTSGKENTGKGFTLNWKPVESSKISNSTTIGVAISIIVILIILAVVFVLWKRKNNDEREQNLVDLPPNQSGPGMGNRHNSENSLYGVVPGTTDTRVTTNRSSRHDSENSLYGVTTVRDA